MNDECAKSSLSIKGVKLGVEPIVRCGPETEDGEGATGTTTCQNEGAKPKPERNEGNSPAP